MRNIRNICLGTLVASFILNGCGSGSSNSANDDAALADPTTMESTVFLPLPTEPFPASDETDALRTASDFEASFTTFIEAYFEQVNEVFNNLSQGKESHADRSIAAVDNLFYDDLLSKCIQQYAPDGVEIVGITCPPSQQTFLEFRLRHPDYKEIYVVLRSGSINNDANTSIRYDLNIYQYAGLAEQQMRIIRYANDEFFLKYGLLDSIECDSVSTSASTVDDENINECAAALRIANDVLVLLNSD